MNVRINGDYFQKEDKPVGLYYESVAYLVQGKDSNSVYYL
jgi:hypothetical protein